MDADAIKARVAELKAQSDQKKADLIAISGAIQDCEYWLEQITKIEVEVDPCPPST